MHHRQAAGPRSRHSLSFILSLLRSFCRPRFFRALLPSDIRHLHVSDAFRLSGEVRFPFCMRPFDVSARMGITSHCIRAETQCAKDAERGGRSGERALTFLAPRLGLLGLLLLLHPAQTHIASCSARRTSTSIRRRLLLGQCAATL